jgi:hypothetical protein
VQVLQPLRRAVRHLHPRAPVHRLLALRQIWRAPATSKKPQHRP